MIAECFLIFIFIVAATYIILDFVIFVHTTPKNDMYKMILNIKLALVGLSLLQLIIIPMLCFLFHIQI